MSEARQIVADTVNLLQRARVALEKAHVDAYCSECPGATSRECPLLAALDYPAPLTHLDILIAQQETLIAGTADPLMQGSLREELRSQLIHTMIEEIGELHLQSTAKGVIAEVIDELARARRGHHDMASFHEGWAVIYEELDELWDEVKAKEFSRDGLRKEAVQTAAMAVRFVEDLLERKSRP